MAQGLLWNMDAPIIRRIDENDVYKILMMYLIWFYYENLKVTFAFKNRTTNVQLSKYVNQSELREQLKATAALRFTDEVLAIYRSWDMFPEAFLQALKKLSLVEPEFGVDKDGELFVRSSGSWFEVTLWETFVLPIVSELYGRGRAKAEGITEEALFKAADDLLTQKINFFKKCPELMIAQFGLRRRFSGPWEEHATHRLLTETSVITGVSNMYLASKSGVPAQGTNAHELVMAIVALASHSGPKAMRDAVYLVLKLWRQLYSHKSLIMLDDAYGSDLFRRDLPRQYLESFKGFRHDSGDPFAYGEAVIANYKRYGIDSREKMIIFSDGLKPELVVKLYKHFNDRIIVAFGMGTNLTNDMGLILPLSLVMKIIEAAGQPAVKLSNNINKATGLPSAVDYFKMVFGYTNTASQDVVY